METGVIRQAVILAGGDEARDEPSPLAALSADGLPFIHYTLWNLARHGVTEVLVSGDPGQSLAAAVETHPVPGVSVRFAADCLPLLDERLFVLDGRSFFDVNYLDLALRAGDGGAVALRREDDPSSDGGVCCLSRDMLTSLSGGMAALRRDLFPRLAGRVYSGLFIGLDNAAARTALPAWKRKPALFLDRDGVLNVNHGYVHTREKWTWCSGAREAVKFANDAGLLVILITNQSGIGRGYYGQDAFHGLMAWVGEELAAAGAHLDGVYHCPHHPTEGVGEYRQECACRKPNPGMMLQALDEWEIDVERSAVIGDSERDLEAGRRVGVRRLKLYDPDRENLLDVVRDVFSFLSEQ